MHSQFVYCGVVELFDGCLFEHLVGDFHLPVCPWVPELCRAMINSQRLIGLIKRVNMIGFERFYNYEHRHSKIRFVSPVERHNGKDLGILAARKRVYEVAMREHPQRWSRKQTRNWTPIGAVALNPVKED